jgi:hypothetical protein
MIHKHIEIFCMLFVVGVACGYTSPLQGIGRYAKTIHQAGCSGVACNGNQQFGAAEAAARQADATVLVMGLDQSIEAEFKDRVGLLLPGHQQELVTRVARASRGPTVLVLMSGGPIDVSFAKNDPRISAILWAGYPGQAGGTAIADILFGTTNPGRVAISLLVLFIALNFDIVSHLFFFFLNC